MFITMTLMSALILIFLIVLHANAQYNSRVSLEPPRGRSIGGNDELPGYELVFVQAVSCVNFNTKNTKISAHILERNNFCAKFKRIWPLIMEKKILYRFRVDMRSTSLVAVSYSYSCSRFYLSVNGVVNSTKMT